MREVNERDKRKCSVILRGFNCNNVGAVSAKFGEICQALEIGSVELSDVRKVGNSALFRAKILDDEKRRELLMAAKKLKSMLGHENVYVQKDLTYRQRQELIARRQVRTGQDGGQAVGRMNEGGLYGSGRERTDHSPVGQINASTRGRAVRGHGTGRGRGGRGRGKLVPEIGAN